MAGQADVHLTQRSDWDAVVVALFSRVIDRAPFGVGVVAREKTLLGHNVRYRLNPQFRNPAVGEYLRRQLKGGTFDKLFESDEGLEALGNGLYKVVGNEVGVPRNAILTRVAHAANPSLRAVVIFGGERMEGQLEQRISVLRQVLAGEGAAGGPGRGAPQALDTPEKLQAALQNINVKRLYDYDMDLLSRIVNGLEDMKEELPKTLKPKFHSVSEYIIKRRVRR